MPDKVSGFNSISKNLRVFQKPLETPPPYAPDTHIETGCIFGVSAQTVVCAVVHYSNLLIWYSYVATYICT